MHVGEEFISSKLPNREKNSKSLIDSALIRDPKVRFDDEYCVIFTDFSS